MNLARKLVVWGLMLALPICGASSTLAVLLGSKHFHTSVAAAAPPSRSLPALADFRRSSLATPTPTSDHAHSWLARHQHASVDDSVIALDTSAGSDTLPGTHGSGPDGSAALVLAVFSGTNIWQLDASACAWHADAASPLTSCDLRRLERPPRT